MSLPSVSVRTKSSTRDVVLLDRHGRPCGSAPKWTVHRADTPLHLGFSCYVFDANGRVLLTQRASTKPTWPSVWSNACCGHPAPGEDVTEAVRRHLFDELGLVPSRLRCAIPDFTYRAEMDDGIVEHELCPTFVAEVEGPLCADPDEVDAYEWVTWPQLLERATKHPLSLSPWSVSQVGRLSAMMADPLAWLRQSTTRSNNHDIPRIATPVGQPLVEGTGGGSVNGRVGGRVGGEHVPVASDPFTPMGTQVDDLVVRFLADRERVLADLDPLVAELTAQVGLLFAAGGKRLRPSFVYWGHHSGGNADDGNVSSAAAAVEMLHTFALIHDDVMDRSTVRRGADAAHVQFADLHRASDAGGDSGWFGASAAIMAGDLAFVWADELLDLMDCDPATAKRVRAVFSQLRTEVIAGQYLDIRLAGSPATQQQAANIALLKSGRYTVTRPLELGAALAGVDERTAASLRSYGDAAGVAFQLRDDVLGVFGDPTVTGKSASDDLRDGKASLLLVRALELSSGSGHRLLAASLGNDDLDEATEARCRDIVADCGALASIETLIASRLAEAEQAVEHVLPTARCALVSLAHHLTYRAA